MTTTCWSCGCSTGFLLVHHFLFYTNVHLLSDNVCEVGMPQVTSLGVQVFCGRGPNREDCKAGYKCNIHPTDRYAVCCRKGTLQQFTIHTPYRAYMHSYSQNSGQILAAGVCNCLLKTGCQFVLVSANSRHPIM